MLPAIVFVEIKNNENTATYPIVLRFILSILWIFKLVTIPFKSAVLFSIGPFCGEDSTILMAPAETLTGGLGHPIIPLSVVWVDFVSSRFPHLACATRYFRSRKYSYYSL